MIWYKTDSNFLVGIRKLLTNIHLQVYPWRTYSDNYGEKNKQQASVEKPSDRRIERRFSLDAVAAGVKLYSTTYHKPIYMVRLNRLAKKFIRLN